MSDNRREAVVPLTAAAEHGGRGASLTLAIVFLVALMAAVSTDVVRAGSGVKSDEATYVSMALSLAFDHDVSYQRRDLERFWGLYGQGPEGIFLKKGKQFRVRPLARPPFVAVENDTPDLRDDRLFFGKALIYAVAAAPFVRVFGMSGFLVLHVLLLGLVCVCGYRFLVASGARPASALSFALAFVFASAVPVYTVFLMPEVMNFTLVFVAYFLWSYKEVGAHRGGWLVGRWTDWVAAVLVAAATYSKPTHAPLIAPMVLWLWWRRELVRGAAVGLVFAVVVGALFTGHALVTGEFNYQGGDRATFYGRFPFDGSTPDPWVGRALASTNDSDAASVLDPSEFTARFGHNVVYFFVGRHFGFIPYYFPGAVAVVAWGFSRRRRDIWRALTVASVGLAAVLLLVFAPYTWSGGGGPPGNRYFLSLYPALFFVVPPVSASALGLVAWIGGALFTAKILVSPFAVAKYTWELTEKGLARRLPVELTMANDLPVMLDLHRAHIPYGTDPTLLLYFLDRHAFAPEPHGMWLSGAGRADVIVRSDEALDHLQVTAESPIRTTLSIACGGRTLVVPLVPGQSVSFDVPTRGVRGLNSYAYLLTATSSDGFTPHVLDPTSVDNRNLGVLMRFKGVERRSR